MGLQSAFDLLLGQSRPLVGIDDLIWNSLSAGAGSPKHSWNLGTIVTIASSPASSPAARTVVLRRADAATRTVDCHTDRRSQKFQHISSWNGPAAVSWHFYDASSKVQLRLNATATVIRQGDVWDEAWASTPLRSRSAYVSVARPGTSVESDAPPDVSDRIVDWDESERGRDHFVVVRTQVQSADLLYLKREGHVRALVRYDEKGIASASWLVP